MYYIMLLLLGSVVLAARGIAGSNPTCYAGINGNPPLCSTCNGSCTVSSGCMCTTNVSSCLPDPQTCLLNATACCLPSLSWYPGLACCVEMPYCTPGCLSDEVCQYVNSIPACVANTTFYTAQGLSVNNVSTVVTCYGSNMTVYVGKNLLDVLQYNTSAATLSQSNCTGAAVSTLQGQRVYSLTVQTSDGTCGNIMTKNETAITYTNTIKIPGKNINGIITGGNLSIQFSCAYNITMYTSLFTVFHPVISTENLNSGGTGGDALTTLAAYVNPTYTQPLQQSQQQELPVGSTLYFGMSTQFFDPAFVLRIDQCFATPTSDGTGSNKVQLIQGGCQTNNVPGIQVIENGISKEVRFSITSFSFRGFDSVYIFCDARLCNSASGTCSSCSSSRDLSEGTVQFKLGPFSFLDYLQDFAGFHKGSSFALVLGSLMSLWILLSSRNIYI